MTYCTSKKIFNYNIVTKKNDDSLFKEKKAQCMCFIMIN